MKEGEGDPDHFDDFGQEQEKTKNMTEDGLKIQCKGSAIVVCECTLVNGLIHTCLSRSSDGYRM